MSVKSSPLRRRGCRRRYNIFFTPVVTREKGNGKTRGREEERNRGWSRHGFHLAVVHTVPTSQFTSPPLLSLFIPSSPLFILSSSSFLPFPISAPFAFRPFPLYSAARGFSHPLYKMVYSPRVYRVNYGPCAHFLCAFCAFLPPPSQTLTTHSPPLSTSHTASH